jgi:hypothetical protein
MPYSASCPRSAESGDGPLTSASLRGCPPPEAAEKQGRQKGGARDIGSMQQWPAAHTKEHTHASPAFVPQQQRLPCHARFHVQRTGADLGEGGQQSRLLTGQDGAQVCPHIFHLLHSQQQVQAVQQLLRQQMSGRVLLWSR